MVFNSGRVLLISHTVIIILKYILHILRGLGEGPIKDVRN